MSKNRKRSTAKLTLRRSTLRRLTEAQLEKVHGGFLPTTQDDSCVECGSWGCPNYGGDGYGGDGGWGDWW